MPKNWYLRTVVLRKTPESPLDSKEIKPVNLKGYQPWIFTGRADAEAEAPVSWSSNMNRSLIGKVPDALERLMAEGEEGVRGWDGWTASPMLWTWTWANFRRWWGTGRPGEVTKSWTQLGDWITTFILICRFFFFFFAALEKLENLTLLKIGICNPYFI